MITVSYIPGLEKVMLGTKDQEKIIKIFSLSENFFTNFDRSKVIEFSDFLDYKKIPMKFYKYIIPEGSFLEKFVAEKANGLRVSKIPSEKYFFIANGPDLFGENGRGGECTLNICFIEFKNEKRIGWIYSDRLITAVVHVVRVFISPMFITVNELYIK